MTATEILIVGGGPAGVATAVALAQAGYATCIVEQSRYETRRVGEHLAPDCRPLLHALELLPCVLAGGHVPSPGIRVAWDTTLLYERDYVFNVYGSGYNLDRQRFDATLAEAAAAKGVKLLTGTRLVDLDRGAYGWTARLDGGTRDGAELTAQFLVDATGRRASVARRLGARSCGPDRLIALGAWLADGPGTADPWLCIEPIASGWWYVAALPERQLAAVLLTDRDLVSGGVAAAQQLWRLRIEETRHIAPRLRRFGRMLEFRVSAAHSFRLEPPTGPGWLAVGDAAMAVDPLSSMGILSALRSGVAAAATITAHLSGDEAALGRYSAEVGERFKTYLVERSAVYATERRWRALPFWKRRAGSPLSLVI